MLAILKCYVGPGRVFDTDKYFVVCANVLGSCYGTTGPQSLNPATGTTVGQFRESVCFKLPILAGKPYGRAFPEVTVADSVRLHREMVFEGLQVRVIVCFRGFRWQRLCQVEKVAAVVGGSLGGMQALEWAVQCAPHELACVAPIACGSTHGAWQIGVSESQRQAIFSDENWKGGYYSEDKAPTRGRKIFAFSFRVVPMSVNRLGCGATNCYDIVSHSCSLRGGIWFLIARTKRAHSGPISGATCRKNLGGIPARVATEALMYAPIFITKAKNSCHALMRSAMWCSLN